MSYVFNFRWIKIPRKISPLVRDNSAEIYPLPVFSAEGHREKFWHGQGCPLFDVVHPAFSVPTMAPLTLQGSLKERLSWRVTCPNHTSGRLLTVARRGSCGPTRSTVDRPFTEHPILSFAKKTTTTNEQAKGVISAYQTRDATTDLNRLR